MEKSPVALTSFYEKLPLVSYQGTQKGVERTFTHLSPSIERLLGVPACTFLDDSRAFFRCIHEEDRNKYLRIWDQVSQKQVQEIQVEYRLLTAEGKSIWVREYGIVMGMTQEGETSCYGLLFMIQNPDLLIAELGRWDRELRSLTESLPDWIGRIDRKFRVLYVNRSWESCQPVPPEDYLGKSVSEIGVPSQILPVVLTHLQDVFSDSQKSTFELSCPLDNGEVKFYEFRLIPEFDRKGDFLTVLLICRDLSEARASQVAFKESEEKFRQLAESIESVFWIWDPNKQQVIYVSPAYERIWGGNAQRLMANPFDWLTLVVPEDRRRVENIFFNRLDRKRLDVEYRMFSKDNQVRWIHNRTFPIDEGPGQELHILGIAQDVTERKQWEEERLRNAKLESLGLLAGGLAHDFNNLLTAILGQVSLAKYGLEAVHPLYRRLTEAENAALRAQDIAKQLLTFSKGGNPVKQTMVIRELIEENVRLILAGSTVCPVFDFEDPLDPVSIDPGQISQVLHNLVINARQAMPKGGECRVRVYQIDGEQGEVGMLDQLNNVPPRWVRVDITDQGIGIPEEYLEKIFDPYFTTKPAGSGLGLATSFSIIRNHGGRLFVQSELSQGSTFSFVLPVVHATKAEPVLSDTHLQKGEGEILIMDDEMSIRRVLGEMVETCGYSFQSAKDGEEALQLFVEAQKRGHPFSGVILDLTIPGGMGGKEVIRELLRLDPDVKAIVVSGYSNDPVLANYLDYGFKGRVAKPFNLLELSTALHAALRNHDL